MAGSPNCLSPATMFRQQGKTSTIILRLWRSAMIHKRIIKPLIFTLSLVILSGVAQADIKRTSSGKPDLTGAYDAGTLTPMNRPTAFGDKQFMTREEADALLAASPWQHWSSQVQTATRIAGRQKKVVMVIKLLVPVVWGDTTLSGSTPVVMCLRSMARFAHRSFMTRPTVASQR